MNRKAFLTGFFILLVPASGVCQLQCVQSYSDSTSSHRLESVSFESARVTLSGELYLPAAEGLYPGVILIPGGGNNTEILRNTPVFMAKRMANCGIAAMVYDKRGTGHSGGTYTISTFDHFINDAGEAIDFLAGHEEIHSEQVGALGFSQGGRLTPNIAVRNSTVSFIASVSGPIYSVAQTRFYAFKHSLERSQVSDSLREEILPVWEEYFQALDTNDKSRLRKLDDTIEEMSATMHSQLLPPLSHQIPQHPIFNSMGTDFTGELGKLNVPWYLLYGEDDHVVPVSESINQVKEKMKEAGHTEYQIELLDSANHMLVNKNTDERYRFEEMIIRWILDITNANKS